jgi:hypothetical protein
MGKTKGVALQSIMVTQAGLRHVEQLGPMITYVNGGGRFDEAALGSYAIRHNLPKVAPLIEIAQFEDGGYALHNGHHRLTAIYLGRQDSKLHSSEYFIRNWKYQDYIDIILPAWVTPFDVRTHLRIPELAVWKAKVREVYIARGEAETIRFIEEFKHEFVIPRGQISNIASFVDEYNLYEHIP